MFDLLVAAIPYYVALMLFEMATFRRAHDADRERHFGYERADTRTSLTMGVGSLVLGQGWNIINLAALALIYDQLAPFHFDMSNWWSWVIVIVAVDFFYYLDHRFHHRVRFGWASHVVHHSSQHFNLSTALRQTWTPLTSYAFFMPIALMGFTPKAFVVAYAVNLLYQFWIHTERIKRMPAWFEFIFNTPSHHRVHHGADEQYLDKNYAGILIIWDRMFGSFAAETDRPTYGLTTNIETYQPLRVAFHEWVAMLRDARRAPRWRDKLGYIFGPPGWQPKNSEQVSAPDPTGLETQTH
jgi:sterol desaturase/sphingolipid hydroxylase (fatty acid hydroxylase superfamily)